MDVAVWLLVVPVALMAGWYLFLTLRRTALHASHGKPVDFSTLALTRKPNQYLLAPKGCTRVDAHGEPPVFPVAPERLRDALLRVIEAEPRAQVLERSGDGMRFTVVQTTPAMRYPDYACIEVRAVEGGSTVLVYSRSVFGIRDFGVNRRRVEGWLDKVKARL